MKTESHETSFCEKEPSVAAAMLAGAISDDLRAHISGCTVCAEVLLVSQLLASEVDALSKEVHIPDASVVWRRAQTVSKEQAIVCATRPIRIARVCACAVAVLALPWAGFTFFDASFWLSGVARYSWTMNHSLSAALTGTSLVGIVGSVVLVTLSSWYILHQE